MATIKMDGGGKSPKKTATKRVPTMSLKKEMTTYSKSGDTTKVQYPERISSGGVKSQLTKITVSKKKKM
jgi:hypothetical protein